MRWTALIGIVVVGCGTERVEERPDLVTGCDDPAVWTATPIEEAMLSANVGGMPCTPAQYPLHAVSLGWYTERVVPIDEELRLDRTCWRVVEASEGSGWSADAELSATGYYARANVLLQGSGASMTVEGRVLRDDGTLALAVPPQSFALRDVAVLDEDASATIAVMGQHAWAERNAVHLRGQRIETDEVLGGASLYYTPDLSYPVTLHRTTDGIVWRRWPLGGDAGEPIDVNLGPGTRARIVDFSAMVVIDDELVLMDVGTTPQVRQRITLEAEPEEIVGTYLGLVMHVGDELVRYDYNSAPRALAVADGVLLPAMTSDFPVFFDGTTFHRMKLADDVMAFDDAKSFAPTPADLAAIGAPVAVLDGVVFGERGLLASPDGEAHGPRVATFTELFGGGSLGPLGPDGAAYVIRRADGSAKLHGAYVANYCPI